MQHTYYMAHTGRNDQTTNGMLHMFICFECAIEGTDQVLISSYSIQRAVLVEVRQQYGGKCQLWCVTVTVHSKQNAFACNYRRQETSYCLLRLLVMLIAFKCNDNMESMILMKANKTLWIFRLASAGALVLSSDLMFATLHEQFSTVNRIGDASTSAVAAFTPRICCSCYNLMKMLHAYMRLCRKSCIQLL